MNRSRALAVIGLLVGSGIALMSYLPVWVSYRSSANGLPSVSVELTGRQLVPTAAALALVALAGSVVVWALRGWWVRLAGALLVIATWVMVVDPLRLARHPLVFVAAADASRTGQSSVGVFANVPIDVRLWWLVASCGGLIAFAAALLVLFHRGRWQGMSARYSRTNASADIEPRQARTGAAAWDALDRGDDPTVRAGEDPPRPANPTAS